MSLHNYSALTPGLYENLLDDVLQAQIAKQSLEKQVVTDEISEDDFPKVFSQYLATRVEYLLKTTHKKDRLRLVASIMNSLVYDKDAVNTDSIPLELTLDKKNVIKVLTEVKERAESPSLKRPVSNLLQANLITNAPHDLSLEHELSSEFDSADQVDAVIAFIKVSSIRTLYSQFQKLHARGIPIRIITSTYTGATERRALDKLVRDFGVQVKVSYNPSRTRLHAKSWLIHRNTGFNTAYIGSSNLSRVALQTGSEWNVRLSEANVPEVFSKFRSVFDSYWNSPEYELYNPDIDAEKFDTAIAEARGVNKAEATGDRSFLENFSLLEVTPFPHQKVMLSELDAERESGHHRNLLVAATGTGKTVIAAFDYKRMRESFSKKFSRPPRTLFVAHRQEILKHAWKTFVDVVKVPNLGISTTDNFSLKELDSHSFAEHENLVFASIQSLHAKSLDGFPADFFDFIIIDEFHHASAPTYRKLMSHFNPTELLGLTATPERGDGTNVATDFFNGRIASELRLWDAMEADLLVPFHYFVTADNTDLSQIDLIKGEYDVKSLNNVYVGNTQRANIIMQAIKDKVPSPETMRAICFCVSVEHANYMADCFNKLGITAQAVTAQTPNRENHIKALKDGSLRIICAVDIFNEGVDIPEVDTLIMLRPTQSATVFLQQLGRGLRKAFGKEVLTVLDFVGNQNKKFRFENKFKIFTRNSRNRLPSSLEKGFHSLPSGVYIEFDKKSQSIVLASLKETLKPTLKHLQEELKELAGSQDFTAIQRISFADFLEFSNRELWDVYSRVYTTKNPNKTYRMTFNRLKQLACGQKISSSSADEISNRMSAFLHIGDVERLEAYKFLLIGDFISYDLLDERMKLYAHMLVYNIWKDGKSSFLNGSVGTKTRFTSMDQALNHLRSHRDVVNEIIEVMQISVNNNRHRHRRPLGRLANYPLLLDAEYTREELLAAFKQGYEFKPSKTDAFPTPDTVREGVWSSDSERIDALLVTLQKGEKDIAYEDYAISEDLFHWQSKTITSPTSKTGRRYVNHVAMGWTIALFVRNSRKNEAGTGAPYTYCGPTKHIASEGSKPMSITWALENPLSPHLYVQARAVAS